MGGVRDIREYGRGEVDVAIGRNGNMSPTVRREVLVRVDRASGVARVVKTYMRPRRRLGVSKSGRILTIGGKP